MSYIVPDGYMCPLCGLLFYGGGCGHSAVDIMVGVSEKINAQAAEIARLTAYCDQLAAGYPDGMLPTDIQVIKDANWALAQQVAEKDAEIKSYRRDIVRLNGRVAELNAAVENAVKVAVKYGGIDGAHHKDWVIDQIVRAIAGDKYAQVVEDACNGEDGPSTYDWDCGIAP